MLTVALFYVLRLRPVYAGILAHRGVGVQEMFDHLFFTTEGILVPTWRIQHLSSLYLIWFLFGSYGFGQVVFIDLANAVAGWAGPAIRPYYHLGLMAQYQAAP